MSIPNMENKNNRKAIQILRGSNDKIVNSTDRLLDGQLLYNKDKNYLTVGKIVKKTDGTINEDDSSYKFISQPIRVRELGGYSSDDSSIGKENTGEFYIKHLGGSLNIYDSSFLEIKCPQIRIAAREEGSPNSIEISANKMNLNTNQRVGISTGGSLELSFYDSMSIKDKNDASWFTAIPPTSSAPGRVTSNYDLHIENESSILAHVDSTTAQITLTSVYGNNKITLDRGNITATGNISCGSKITLTATSGQVVADSFNATSDVRLKTNIKPLTYHDSILDIPVCEYDWKESGKHAMGFIAQDLKEVYPELVDENEEGILSIKETKLVYLLIEEVRKLKEEIGELKK